MATYTLNGGEYNNRTITIFGKPNMIKIPRKLGALSSTGGHYVYSVSNNTANFLGFYSEEDMKSLEEDTRIIEYEFVSNDLN